NANGAFFVEGHGSASLPGLLSKRAQRCGHYRRRGARFQYFASDDIDHWRPPDFRPSNVPFYPRALLLRASVYKRLLGGIQRKPSPARAATHDKALDQSPLTAFLLENPLSRVVAFRVGLE